MDWKLEVIVVPVADVDRSLAFCRDQVGFRLDVDHRAGNFRVVQMTPPGSACSVALMPGPAAPGALQGIQLVVRDSDAAREKLVARGVRVSELFHFDVGLRRPGHHPDRAITLTGPTTARFSPSTTPTATVGSCRRSAASVRPADPAGARRWVPLAAGAPAGPY